VTKGEIGDPANPPNGCRFHPRCPFAIDRCQVVDPVLTDFDGREAACIRLESVR
jgi:oligopeptide/dipeptide ABC transporter ATP-binding protein